MSMRAAFTRVYKDGDWANGSGPGSGEHETQVWREFLTRYMRRNRVRSVLDLGCGDWQSTRLIDWKGISYTGIDVVPRIVADCREKYARPKISFVCADILEAPWPQADLIICKEVLQHWPLEAMRAFRKRAAFRRCLLVNDYAPLAVIPDIMPGGYRPLDLTAPPLRWPVRPVLTYTLEYPDGARERKLAVEL